MPTNLHPLGMRPVRVMVALDGSSLAEASLLPAAYLSTALSAPLPGALHLVRVLPLAWLNEDDEVVIAAKKKAVEGCPFLSFAPVYKNPLMLRQNRTPSKDVRFCRPALQAASCHNRTFGHNLGDGVPEEGAAYQERICSLIARLRSNSFPDGWCNKCETCRWC